MLVTLQAAYPPAVAQVVAGQRREEVQELEEEDMQFIEMRFFEKRAFKEIADIFGITENNAKVKTYRILEKLKKIITGKSTNKA